MRIFVAHKYIHKYSADSAYLMNKMEKIINTKKEVKQNANI